MRSFDRGLLVVIGEGVHGDTDAEVLISLIGLLLFNLGAPSPEELGQALGRWLAGGVGGGIKVFFGTASGMGVSLGDAIVAAPQQIYDTAADATVEATGSPAFP